MEEITIKETKVEDTPMEENKVEDILFVAVKEEPHSEDSMPEYPIKDELKHEETEITDVHNIEEEKKDPVASSITSNFSNKFPKKRKHSEEMTDSSSLEQRIKEEMEDSPGEEDDDANATYTHPCSNCSEVFKNETNLRSHLKSVHNMAFSCIICSEGFVTAKDVNEHSKSAHNFSCCEHCLENFGRFSCSFKGNICTHDYDIKVTESAAS